MEVEQPSYKELQSDIQQLVDTLDECRRVFQLLSDMGTRVSGFTNEDFRKVLASCHMALDKHRNVGY